MKKIILTKYCNTEELEYSEDRSFEEKFELYIENKVKKIVNSPKKYPFIQIVYNREEL